MSKFFCYSHRSALPNGQVYGIKIYRYTILWCCDVCCDKVVQHRWYGLCIPLPGSVFLAIVHNEVLVFAVLYGTAPQRPLDRAQRALYKPMTDKIKWSLRSI